MTTIEPPSPSQPYGEYSLHISLSIICKILEREGKRALYVSRQVSNLLKIRSEYDNDDIGSEGSADGNLAASNAGSTDVDNNTNGNTGTAIDGGKTGGG